jgi:hypothetical protein
MTDHLLGDLEDEETLPHEHTIVSERANRASRDPTADSTSSTPLSDPPEDLDEQSVDENGTPANVGTVTSACEETPALPVANSEEMLAPALAIPEETDHKDALIVEREKLRSLLYWEFNDTGAYDDVMDACGLESEDACQNAEQMCARTQEINKLLISLWKADENTTKKDMGEESFKIIHGVVKKWVSWRNVIVTLAGAQYLHPLQEGPKPRLTLVEWRDRMEGLPRFKHFERQLFENRRWFEQPGNSLEEVSEHVAVALASATRTPFGPDYYKDELVMFNKKFSSWKLSVL